MVTQCVAAIKVSVIAAAVTPLDLFFEDGVDVPSTCADSSRDRKTTMIMTIVQVDIMIGRVPYLQ